MDALIIKYDISQKVLLGPSGVRRFKWIQKKIGTYADAIKDTILFNLATCADDNFDIRTKECSDCQWIRIHNELVEVIRKIFLKHFDA